jgi:hypothetical protein
MNSRDPRKIGLLLTSAERLSIFHERACTTRISFFFLWLYSPIKALAASMKLSVSLQFLDLGESVGCLGRVISSSQGLYLYTNTEKRTHNANNKHPCPEWDSKPRSRRPRGYRDRLDFIYYSFIMGFMGCVYTGICISAQTI